MLHILDENNLHIYDPIMKFSYDNKIKNIIFRKPLVLSTRFSENTELTEAIQDTHIHLFGTRKLDVSVVMPKRELEPNIFFFKRPWRGLLSLV